jgi:hypothetical protein
MEESVLAAVCITIVIHSLTHNDGFFKLEPTTEIVFGMLWGAAAKIMYPRFNNLIKKRVIE